MKKLSTPSTLNLKTPPLRLPAYWRHEKEESILILGNGAILASISPSTKKDSNGSGDIRGFSVGQSLDNTYGESWKEEAKKDDEYMCWRVDIENGEMVNTTCLKATRQEGIAFVEMELKAMRIYPKLQTKGV